MGSGSSIADWVTAVTTKRSRHHRKGFFTSTFLCTFCEIMACMLLWAASTRLVRRSRHAWAIGLPLIVLLSASPMLLVAQSDSSSLTLRVIVVPSEPEAAQIRDELKAGKDF